MIIIVTIALAATGSYSTAGTELMALQASGVTLMCGKTQLLHFLQWPLQFLTSWWPKTRGPHCTRCLWLARCPAASPDGPASFGAPFWLHAGVPVPGLGGPSTQCPLSHLQTQPGATHSALPCPSFPSLLCGEPGARSQGPHLAPSPQLLLGSRPPCRPLPRAQPGGCTAPLFSPFSLPWFSRPQRAGLCPRCHRPPPGRECKRLGDKGQHVRSKSRVSRHLCLHHPLLLQRFWVERRPWISVVRPCGGAHSS